MIYVQIPKDLNKVKTKIAFNLTKRQLIGFSVSLLIGLPIYLYTRAFLGNDISVILVMILTFPIFFITFYEKDGLKFEVYLKSILKFKFYHLRYRIRREEKLIG